MGYLYTVQRTDIDNTAEYWTKVMKLCTTFLFLPLSYVHRIRCTSSRKLQVTGFCNKWKNIPIDTNFVSWSVLNILTGWK